MVEERDQWILYFFICVLCCVGRGILVFYKKDFLMGGVLKCYGLYFEDVWVMLIIEVFFKFNIFKKKKSEVVNI